MLPGLTIDGKNSQDLDDAIWAVEERDRIRLWISIAAVAETVEPRSLQMQQALVWLESRYRGERCIRSMLSPKLTESHSLLPQRERPVLALELVLQADGKIVDRTFQQAILQSQGRIDYDSADLVLAGKQDSPFGPQLQTLARAANWLDRGRQGMWGHAIGGEFRNDIGQVVSGSRQLIASTAIAYNALAAEMLAAANLPSMYRVQDVYQVEEFKGVFAEFGEDPQVLAPLISHRLPRAQHQPTVGPHWALKLPGYTRSSSPLRRVEDLVNQQQLIAALKGDRSCWSRNVLSGLCERIEDRAIAYDAKQRDRAIEQRDKPLETPVATIEVTSNQFTGLLERAAESGQVSQALDRLIDRYIAEDKFTPRHAAVILSRPFHTDIRQRTLAAVLQNTPTLNAISVLNSMEQIGLGTLNYGYSGEGTEWSCQLKWQSLQETGKGKSKSEARAIVSRQMLKLICQSCPTVALE